MWNYPEVHWGTSFVYRAGARFRVIYIYFWIFLGTTFLCVSIFGRLTMGTNVEVSPLLRPLESAEVPAMILRSKTGLLARLRSSRKPRPGGLGWIFFTSYSKCMFTCHIIQWMTRAHIKHVYACAISLYMVQIQTYIKHINTVSHTRKVMTKGVMAWHNGGRLGWVRRYFSAAENVRSWWIYSKTNQ